MISTTPKALSLSLIFMFGLKSSEIKTTSIKLRRWLKAGVDGYVSTSAVLVAPKNRICRRIKRILVENS